MDMADSRRVTIGDAQAVTPTQQRTHSGEDVPMQETNLVDTLNGGADADSDPDL